MSQEGKKSYIWDELWKGIEWDRVTTIPFITERIHKIKAMGDMLKEKAEKYDEEHKAAMIVEEELRKIDDKLEAVKKEVEPILKESKEYLDTHTRPEPHNREMSRYWLEKGIYGTVMTIKEILEASG